MKTTAHTCDNCQRDISESNGMRSFRLALRAEKIKNSSGFEYAVYVSPPIERDMHFCGTACLADWVDTIRPKVKAA